MKTYSLLFLFIPFFCFAQEDRNKASAKPSTTDCPTWNKKSKKTSKAEYFQYLRTAKPQSRAQTNYSTPADSKTQPTTVQQRTKNSEQTKEKKTFVQKTEENQTTTAPHATVGAGGKEEKNPATAAEKKGEDKKVITETVDKSQPETNEKLEEEKTKFKQKLTRLTRKTTKIRRHSNSKCPSF